MRFRKTVSIEEDAEEWIIRRIAITKARRGEIIYDALKIAAIFHNQSELAKIFPENHELIYEALEKHKVALRAIPLPDTFDA